MKKLAQYKVSTRMIIMLSVIFILTIITTSVSMLRLKGLSDSFETMMDKPMTKYQMVNDWYGNSNASITRSTIISISTDTTLTQKFAEDAKNSTEIANKLQKDIDPLIVTKEARAAYDRILVVRQEFLKERKTVEKYKAEGNMDAAKKHFEEVYLPVAKEYRITLYELVKACQSHIKDKAKQARQTYEEGRNIVIVLSLITVLLGITLSVLITRSILKELGGEPAYAADITKLIASGNLSVSVKTQADDKNSLLYNLEEMRKSLMEIVSEVRLSANSISNAAVEIAAGNQDLSSRTEEQASSLEETASSMEEITSTVRQNADSAKEAQALVSSTVNSANDGGKVVNEVVDMMNLIKGSSQKVVDIISVIDSIAFQTNILALNAAVEAARAGEQGRGFAVVASEVRNLAQRSAQAAKEIKVLIGDSVEKVGQGVVLANKAGTTISEVVSNVQSVSHIVNEISEASREQALGVEEVSKAVSQMDGVTQQNAALVEEAAAAADMLQQQTASLTQVVNKFVL